MRGIAFNNIVYAGHITIKRMGGKERKGTRNSHTHGRFVPVFIIGLGEWADRRHQCKTLIMASIVECFHGSELHGLHFAYHISRVIARESGQQCGTQARNGSNFHAFLSQLYLALLQQIPAADGYNKYGTYHP